MLDIVLFWPSFWMTVWGMLINNEIRGIRNYQTEVQDKKINRMWNLLLKEGYDL